VTPFTCEGCHNVGKPAVDGSVGQCQKCHLRHKFSLEQARKPETCNACHIGPDHPQYEIYVESPHGISYHTDGANWNWDAEAGTLTTTDFPAPTCAICHMSGFGTAGTTHDVGDRLTWFLFAPISTRRPSWQDNMVRMQGVCLECHNENFISNFYTAADKLTDRVNEWVAESDQIMAPLQENNLLTSAPFDEPIDFVYFNLWHHWGRTTKFGAWMQGPDYAQWHGAYEVLHDLAELKEQAGEKLDAAGIEP
jgi:hydroxylamine dehydrogenase